MSPSAKSLILDLLSTQREASTPVRALVAAGAIFGLEENNVRVALARLLQRGLVERDERGLYRLGRSAQAVRGRVAGWRRPWARLRPWKGGWVAVLGTPAPGRANRLNSRRAMRWLGMRSLAPGIHVRPDNLRDGAAAVRSDLHGLGLDPTTTVARLDELDADREQAARRLWDVEALQQGYRQSRAALARSAERLGELDLEEAMAESFREGGRVIRQLVLDPLLPDEISPSAERDVLVDALRAYDKLGRSCWAAFMARHQVPHLSHPVDVRVAEAAHHFPALAGGDDPMEHPR